ncbi:MAG: hypothetical protein CMJ49_01925 [Planctomycetaceae bacterium]|nr:hypothetical protein [Planctomycetaceae bacterium]
MADSSRSPAEQPDVQEHGSRGATFDRRLFMQLQVFSQSPAFDPLVAALQSNPLPAVLYVDVLHPRRVALLTFNESPEFFADQLRARLNQPPFAALRIVDALTMFGRTYTLGYEPDLSEALLDRPRRTVLNPDWPWAIWYPLRRSGEFAQLQPDQQRDILMEHGTIGRAFGEADLGRDVRLACHGLDRNDNDFVIGLTGRALTPLSKLIERMRRTQQTSRYIQSLGPFFVGRAVWQSDLPPQ